MVDYRSISLPECEPTKYPDPEPCLHNFHFVCLIEEFKSNLKVIAIPIIFKPEKQAGETYFQD